MTFGQAIILGIVEGITEFLPISSTAHLDIAAYFLGISSTTFFKTFQIGIQLGAILAVVVLYYRLLSRNIEVWKKILIAFVPTAAIGFVLYKIIKDVLLGNFMIALTALFVGGILLIVFELFHKEKQGAESSEQEIVSMSYGRAFLIGLAQALAVIPGVSRAAATIVTGLGLGMRRQAIVEFSFLLAIPTMAAATGYDIYKNASLFSSDQFGVLAIGFIAAFISALLAIKFLLYFVKTKNFIWFGVYRIVIAVILFFIFT